MALKGDELQHFDWLVAARARAQQPLLRLYRFGKGKGNGPFGKADVAWLSTLNLLVGAGFSLWRAAFLSDITRKRSLQALDAIKLLEAVLRDNAVTYTTDRNTKQWMGGYYLNNATFRMQDVRERYQKGRSGIAAIIAFDRLVEARLKGYNQTDAWDVLCNALDAMVQRLEMDDQLPR